MKVFYRFIVEFFSDGSAPLVEIAEKAAELECCHWRVSNVNMLMIHQMEFHSLENAETFATWLEQRP